MATATHQTEPLPRAGSRTELVKAARVLSRLGLVTAYGHVSIRAGTSMVITAAIDLGTITESDLVEVALNGSRLPPGAPAESWVHLALYRARPDAGAIARAQPASAFAVTALISELVPLHGQAAWLGQSVPVYDNAHLLRSLDLADRAAASLPKGDALLLRGNGGVTLGSTPGNAVARMWLLSAACDAWLAVQGSTHITPLAPDEVESWRAVRDEMLPRLWRHLERVTR
jgi:HCOMODA/2-hydroxy-3-carboxy-muconic semialdehyde decarboxylase